MRSDIFPLSFPSAIKTLTFIAGAALLQGCFFGGGGHPYYADPAPYGPSYGAPPAYAYAAPAPTYRYAAPPRIGDYDEHHAWHDRDWWVQNNHPWVVQHHPDWVAHEHDHDHH